MTLRNEEFPDQGSTLLEQRIEEAGMTVASKGKLGTMDITDIRQKAKEAVKDIPSDILNSKHSPQSSKYIKNYIVDFVMNCRKDLSDQLLAVELQNVANEVIDEILGFGPIQVLLNDIDVTEIIVNGPGPGKIQYEKNGKMSWSEVQFRNDEDIKDLIDKMISPINRRVDEKSPMVDSRLPDGSRVNAVIKPIALDGPYLTIRKFKPNFGISDMKKFGTITERDAELFKCLLESEFSIIVSGGTGSGKTTVLNAISEFLPDNAPIVTIEDSAELQLKQRSVRRLETRPPNIEGEGEVTIRDCIKNALRMKTRWLVIGETRDGAAFDMLSGVNTGHSALTTVHCNSAQAVVSRVETLCQMAEASLPVEAIRQYFADAFKIIIHTKQFKKTGIRKVVQITEVLGFEDGKVKLQDVLLYDPKTNQLEPTGVTPRFVYDMIENDVEPPAWLLPPDFKREGA